ncbi:MAG TPA: copper-binding protein [Azospira sp.]|nr:copper-binding protein [Azospira sp.]
MQALLKPLLLLAALAPFPAFAHEAHDHGSTAAMAAGASATALTDGVVKKVDKAAGKVTLTHGPLTNLGMPGMTMAFRVKNPEWLDQLKEGDKVRFLADSVNGVFSVVQLEKVR